MPLQVELLDASGAKVDNMFKHADGTIER